MIQCTLEDNNQMLLRHVTVNAIAVDEMGRILLVKRSIKCIDEPGKYCLPGGLLERGETVMEALKRETKEETGFTLENAYLVGVNDKPDRWGDRQNVTFVFEVKLGEKMATPGGEVENLTWFALDQAKKLKMAFDHNDNLEWWSNKKDRLFMSLG